MKKNEMEYYLDYIREILPKGKSRAVHQEELAERLNIKPATVKTIVRKLRNMGIPICSGKEGYWLAKDSDELRKYTNKERNLGLSKLQQVKAMKENEEIQGQMEMELYRSNNISFNCSTNIKGL